MPLLQLISNPRRRRRRAKRSAARRSTAHLRKYQFKKNPSRRRQRGFATAGGLASLRRGFRLSVPGIVSSLTNGAVGGAGAIGVDLAMGQLGRILPVEMAPKVMSRVTEDGSINAFYYLAKAGIAIGAGVAGQKFLPAGMKRYATTGAEGALAVLSYELLRYAVPVTWPLGYFNPAMVGDKSKVTNLALYQSTRRAGMRGLGYYQQTGAAGPGIGRRRLGANASDTRVGEGTVR